VVASEAETTTPPAVAASEAETTTPPALWPGVFVAAMAAHVLVMIAFVIVIATGFEGRVLFALGIAVVASGGWVAWLRVNSEDL
jgi:hypothetical protein